MAVLFVPMIFLGILMLFKSPKLLEKRLDAKEKVNEQKWVVALSGIMFVAAFVVAGLNFRFSWHSLPDYVIWIGASIFLLSYLIYAEVMRENAFLSRTIEIQESQKVIDTGLYGIVRHPMYTAMLMFVLATNLYFGSILSLVCVLLFVPVLILRILNEEKVLCKELNGYDEYKKKVKYRMIPFLW